MRMSRFTDYSLRTLLYVAMFPDRRVTINQVAEAFGISANHLTKVVHHLGKVGLLTNTRGRKGGLALARPAGNIRVGELVRHTEQPDVMAECFESGNTCPITPACQMHHVLRQAVEAFYSALDRYSLDDLVQNKRVLMQLIPEPAL